MDDQKDTAIADYEERRVKEAERIFQGQVDSALSEISTLSNQLKAAKKRLLELEYKKPEPLDLSSL